MHIKWNKIKSTKASDCDHPREYLQFDSTMIRSIGLGRGNEELNLEAHNHTLDQDKSFKLLLRVQIT